jgi:hypothetical protein
MTQKSLIKIQISPKKNANFEKLSRNLSNRTKVKILKENFFFGDLSKKFGSAYAQSPWKCSNHEILAKIEGKEAKFKVKKNYLMLVYLKRQGYTLAGRCGGGKSIFRKTPDIGLASYSIILLRSRISVCTGRSGW